MAKIEEL